MNGIIETAGAAKKPSHLCAKPQLLVKMSILQQLSLLGRNHLGCHRSQIVMLSVKYGWRAPALQTASRIVAAIGIVVGVLAIGLASYAIVIRSQAEGLLKDLTALTVGKSTEADAQQFTQRHKRLFTSRNCEEDYCVTGFTVRNKWLSALRLEPLAEFDATFTVRNGKVTRIHAKLARSMPIHPTFLASAGIVTEYAEYPPDLAGRQGHYSFPTPIGKPYLDVELDSQASAIERKHAFAFSFRCLVKPGWGCNLSCDYLPLAWQDWKLELQDSGFPMSVFNEHYPNNARCTP
jgi:hypothetical protein